MDSVSRMSEISPQPNGPMRMGEPPLMTNNKELPPPDVPNYKDILKSMDAPGGQQPGGQPRMMPAVTSAPPAMRQMPNMQQTMQHPQMQPQQMQPQQYPQEIEYEPMDHPVSYARPRRSRRMYFPEEDDDDDEAFTPRRKRALRKAAPSSYLDMLSRYKKYLVLAVIVFLALMFGVPKLAMTMPTIVLAPTGQLNLIGTAMISFGATSLYKLVEAYC